MQEMKRRVFVYVDWYGTASTCNWTDTV